MYISRVVVNFQTTFLLIQITLLHVLETYIVNPKKFVINIIIFLKNDTFEASETLKFPNTTNNYVLLKKNLVNAFIVLS